jgi:hypothetical protein
VAASHEPPRLLAFGRERNPVPARRHGHRGTCRVVVQPRRDPGVEAAGGPAVADVFDVEVAVAEHEPARGVVAGLAGQPLSTRPVTVRPESLV